MDIGFHSDTPTEVTITFELNGTDEQSPEYAHLAMSVFQTVMYQVTQYVNKYKPKLIKFNADPTEPTRVSLYKRICKNIEGYSVKEENGWFELTMMDNTPIKLDEVSNPTTISSEFKITSKNSIATKYTNTKNEKILFCRNRPNGSFEFKYGGSFVRTNAGPKESISVFQTVMYHLHTYLHDI